MCMLVCKRKEKKKEKKFKTLNQSLNTQYLSGTSRFRSSLPANINCCPTG